MKINNNTPLTSILKIISNANSINGCLKNYLKQPFFIAAFSKK